MHKINAAVMALFIVLLMRNWFSLISMEPFEVITHYRQH